MKKFLSLLFVIEILASCSIERRLYMPGFHVDCRWSKDNALKKQGHSRITKDKETTTADFNVALSETSSFASEEQAQLGEELILHASDNLSSANSHILPARPQSITHHLSPHPVSVSPDTLKKPFKPQKQYREIDPVGRASVAVVLAGVSLQKIAGILTWFEVIMPLSFGPGVFIPAFAVTIIGLGISLYSAYRVRKYPEKYKKNEWGKAALAILGWQIIMSALFAWLLGGLPIL